MTRRRTVLAGIFIVALAVAALWLIRGSCAIAAIWPDSPSVEAAEKTDLEQRLRQLVDEAARAGTTGPLGGMRLAGVSRTTATIRIRDISEVAADFRVGQRWQAVYADHHRGFSPCVRTVFMTFDGRRSTSQSCCEVPLPRS